MQQQIKLYEDGNRLIVVFENSGNGIKQLITSMFGPIEKNVVPNVTRINVPMELPPNIDNLKDRPAVEDINEDKILQEKGFSGFCEIVSFYKEKAKLLSPARRSVLKKKIDDYTAMMRNRNVEQVSDEELIYVLREGAKRIFPNKMKSCLQQSGFISVEDFLSSGRRNLVDAYLFCFS